MSLPGQAYSYTDAEASHSTAYLLPVVEKEIAAVRWPRNPRALDYGCGNGSLTRWLVARGFSAVGVGISTSGIEIARRAVPEAEFSNDFSADRHGSFDLAICLEVLAHCYIPSNDLDRIFAALRPGGILLLSTPYHGYIKNLAMAATGRLERHLDPTLWTGAQLNFFSSRSIVKLLERFGFRLRSTVRVGRIPVLAKSMIVTSVKPY